MSGPPHLLSPGSCAAWELGERVQANVTGAVTVSREVVRQLAVALLAGGHVLIEDIPGVGKTVLARALAASIDARYARVQCTADMLPADLTGVNVLDRERSTFTFRPGPVFTNVLLVDEINRASARTQSGLLECMQELRVTVDGVSHRLERPFLVVATQNPVEFDGTFPLPQAQLDRFMVRIALGYPSAGEEAELLFRQPDSPVEDVAPVATVGDVRQAQRAAAAVHVSELLRRYVVALLEQTRRDQRTLLGASPRAGLMLLAAARANAALEGRDHVLPDDVQLFAHPVLAHRLLLASGVPPSARDQVVADAVGAVAAL